MPVGLGELGEEGSDESTIFDLGVTALDDWALGDGDDLVAVFSNNRFNDSERSRVIRLELGVVLLSSVPVRVIGEFRSVPSTPSSTLRRGPTVRFERLPFVSSSAFAPARSERRDNRVNDWDRGPAAPVY